VMDNAPNRKNRDLREPVVRGKGAASSKPSPGAVHPTRARITNLLGAVLVIGLSLAIALLLRQYVKASPRFALQQFSVVGLERRTEAEITELSGVKIGANIFSVDIETLRRRLLQDPWIAEANVSRRLPSTMSIEIKERKAAALVALGETFLAARDGSIIKRLDQGDPVDLPLVTGLDGPQLSDDRAGAELSIAKALDIARQYTSTDVAAKHPLQEVHVSKDGTWSLVVGRSGIRIFLGAGPFHRKFEQASRIFRELERRGAKVDAVLLDNDTRPERVVVRMK
jgi:cell division protein FtsQ